MKLGLAWLVGALLACSKNPSPVTQAPDASPPPAADAGGACSCPAGMECGGCSLLTQAGCSAGQKCTWALSTDPTANGSGLGSIECEPAGAVAIGGACTILPAAQCGYDDCVAGSVCLAGTCAQ